MQLASAPCCHLPLLGHSTSMLRNQMLHSCQMVQHGPRWTMGRRRNFPKWNYKTNRNAIFKLQRCSFTHYIPVVTPKTLPSTDRSTKRDTHHNTEYYIREDRLQLQDNILLQKKSLWQGRQNTASRMRGYRFRTVFCCFEVYHCGKPGRTLHKEWEVRGLEQYSPILKNIIVAN